MSTFDKVKELIAQQLNKAPAEITEDKEIVKDLGADSLDLVEMLLSLEENFGVTVSDEQTESIKTVKDIVEIIDNQ